MKQIKKIKYFKKFQLERMKNIQQKSNYIYMLSYNNLTSQQTIKIQKQLKKFHSKLIFFKQKFTKKEFISLKNQGSIFFIYSQYPLASSLFWAMKNIYLLSVFKNEHESIFFSQYKLKNILFKKKKIHFFFLEIIYFLLFFFEKYIKIY